MATERLYYLQNVNAGYLGNAPMFWAKGGNGYTAYLDQSEQMTAEQVREIVRSTHGSHKWKRWPVKATDDISHRVVDVQESSRIKGRR